MIYIDATCMECGHGYRWLTGSSMHCPHCGAGNSPRVVRDSAARSIPMPTPLDFDPQITPGDWEEALRQRIGPILTATETKICARRLMGWSDSQIADELSVSASTVKTHTANILAKLGLESVREIPYCCFCLILNMRAGEPFT